MVQSAEGQTLWVGADQKLAAVDLLNGHVCIALSLMMPLLQILTVDNFTAVLTEQEAILFSPNRTLSCFCVLPDLATQISVSGSGFAIALFEGSRFSLSRSGRLEAVNPEMVLAG